jgi:hypothetical protein
MAFTMAITRSARPPMQSKSLREQTAAAMLRSGRSVKGLTLHPFAWASSLVPGETVCLTSKLGRLARPCTTPVMALAVKFLRFGAGVLGSSLSRHSARWSFKLAPSAASPWRLRRCCDRAPGELQAAVVNGASPPMLDALVVPTAFARWAQSSERLSSAGPRRRFENVVQHNRSNLGCRDCAFRTTDKVQHRIVELFAPLLDGESVAVDARGADHVRRAFARPPKRPSSAINDRERRFGGMMLD